MLYYTIEIYGGKMFDNLIVTNKLLPIRNAASLGDINAIFELLEHVLKGKQTARSGEYAEQLLAALFDHKDFACNAKRAWNCYVLKVHALRILYEEGEMAYEHYLKEGCDYLQMMVKSMAECPREYWDHDQMINAIIWIRDNEPESEEESTG
jgi:hypothetical protein